MGRLPQSFIDDVRLQADILQVVQDSVPLKRAGTTYKGLCPFHAEKTPSFTVNREKGFFYCFGCGTGGDVFKFVELQEKLGFHEVVRRLAERFGVPIPEPARASDAAADGEREALLRQHELAARLFTENLRAPAGRAALDYLHERGLTDETIERLGLGYAPPSREHLKRKLLGEGFRLEQIVRAGLVVDRDGQSFDRFRQRLIIPICREGGAVVAFGGRALGAEQQPKYLNSPETAVYSKSRTLYGLHLSKRAIQRQGYAVLVEGYFDFAQAFQHGVDATVASCGTAFTKLHAQLLRRFAARVVLSFDPDTAGRNAMSRSCDVLVEEGFRVAVAELPAGQDPDGFIRAEGSAAYQERVERATPYLDYLMEQAARPRDFGDPEQRLEFVREMLEVAARIPEAAARDQFADRVAHRARIAEDVVRAEIRRAAVARCTRVAGGGLPQPTDMKPAERDLLASLLLSPESALAALDLLDDEDLVGLAAGRIFRTARAREPEAPGSLLERLSTMDAQLLTRSAAHVAAPAPPAECARALRRLRFERERAQVQVEIDRLQAQDAERHADDILQLWQRKKHLLRQIEELAT